MIGNTYLYNAREVIIEDFRMSSDGVYVQFLINNKWVSFEPKDVKKELLIVETNIAKEQRAIVLNEAKAGNKAMVDLGQILLSNIKKLETDATFLDQAKVINDHAKTLIDIQRTRIEIFKLASEVK
jgi:hypothetical protein